MESVYREKSALDKNGQHDTQANDKLSKPNDGISKKELEAPEDSCRKDHRAAGTQRLIAVRKVD
jgi:hypothetical protein